MLFQAVGVPSVENGLKILFFIFYLLFLLGLFFSFKFCEVLFESFRILEDRAVDVFCQFCVFCDREGRQVWVCDVFCQKLSLFNNMLIDLDRRYLYGLIGRFNIL